MQRNGRDGERKRDQKIISTAPCSVMQIAVTKAVNMAERKEGREGKGPDPQQRKHSNTAGKREETNAQEAKH